MVELFEQDIYTAGRQSSKGNQLKWRNADLWHKADYTGYEGLSEYIVSQLLTYSSLSSDEYTCYYPEEIKYKNKVYNGVLSKHFLKDDWQIITLERLFNSFFGQSLNEAIWKIEKHEERLLFLVNQVIRITGLKDFGIYMNKVLTIDCLFLNEDRHTHNLAVLMDGKGNFDYCPIFDNGACLLADTTLDYPMGNDIYELIDSVKGKTFSTDIEEQMSVSKKLYGENIKFSFTKNDVERLLGLYVNNEVVSIYSRDIRKRVDVIIKEQMRKYYYLFEK